MPKKPLISGMDIWKELGTATEEVEVQPLKGARLIAIERIRPNPHQPRKSLDPEALGELADSIRAYGLLQPLVVCPVEEDFLIIAGHRRYEACKLVGMRHLPCLVREAKDEEILEQSLIENVQREDIKPVEEATCYQVLMEDRHLSIRDMAARVHKSVGYIHGRLELLKYPDVAQGVRAGQIGVFEARELAKVADYAQRQELAQRVISGELDREGLQHARPQPVQLRLFDPDSFSRHWQKMRQELETFDAGALNAAEQARARQLLEEMKGTIERALARLGEGKAFNS